MMLATTELVCSDLEFDFGNGVVLNNVTYSQVTLHVSQEEPRYYSDHTVFTDFKHTTTLTAKFQPESTLYQILRVLGGRVNVPVKMTAYTSKGKPSMTVTCKVNIPFIPPPREVEIGFIEGVARWIYPPQQITFTVSGGGEFTIFQGDICPRCKQSGWDGVDLHRNSWSGIISGCECCGFCY